MKTEKQKELKTLFLQTVDDAQRELFLQLMDCLEGFGYYSQKERSNLSFKHGLHNKQIAKMGIRKGKEPQPFFALRFSACRGYSQRFTDIVETAIIKYPHKTPRCISNGCDYCAGAPDTHIYTRIFPGGEHKSHCGAYALEIPNLSAKDIDEIKKLIKEENDYLLRHEAQKNESEST